MSHPARHEPPEVVSARLNLRAAEIQGRWAFLQSLVGLATAIVVAASAILTAIIMLLASIL